ncbi:MAG TPA: hypothetical protein PLO02_08585 [Tenuifilaceae bacterium]|jgi:hypothetical protein|nr:hypothetical protein [Bacteroidales bacterium]MDI9517000.1 hypothetical protein [Bacteroidota bacterium]NLH56106.1 hypothetical protein [Rikenellaceae bacterium]OQC61159.1 MAG: hypothetical protein BWX49_02432 [Bacteroidetes bacterium ADurb.Bin008]HNV81493.1 hypothetical protein [Tenuifilaceae bacterium]
MKRILIIITACSLSLFAMAQEEYVSAGKPSKGDSEYLPQAGDLGIGVDGTPFFEYFGNMFNGSGYNNLNLGQNTLYFRYYLTDNSAARLAISILSTKMVDNEYVQNDAAVFVNPLSREQLIDRYTYIENGYGITGGYQMFRSYKRLNGFVGADLGYAFYKDKDLYEYGNQMSVANPTPSTAFFGPTGVRTLERNYGATHTVSIGLFTGAEYYFLPKVCIGGEFGLMSGINFIGQSYRTQERMVISRHVEEQIATEPSEHAWFVATLFPYSYFGGSLYFLVNF